LDSTTAREILNLFGRIVREENVTVLIVSHDPLVHDYADYVLQLEDGQIVSSQPSASKTAPDRPRPSAKGR
jgi:ABC-type lipoprotein export system ATPase subunit